MNMKIQSLLPLYSWIWIITSVDAECRDTESCKKEDCQKPGIDQYCKKTCNICTDKGCKKGYYKLSNGSCSSCESLPANLTDSYNKSCGLPCPHGKWGPDCKQNCSIGCKNSSCQRWTGECHGGCKFCFTGTKCNDLSRNCICNQPGECECKKSFYGSNCEGRCSENCEPRVCNDIADCQSGCKSGWYGPKCDNEDECFYCKNGVCPGTTKTCVDGCKPGYYTMKCNKTCGHYCKDNMCTQENGTCNRGCRTGWFNDHCNSTCPVNCKNDNCSQMDGICDNGCNTGYYGERCDKTCLSNCNGNTCSQDGRCNKGCRTGWFSDKCNTKCPVKCNDITCSQDSGRCEKGCFQGWFGDQCNITCPRNCSSDSCNRTDGSCQGCVDGYKGSHCNTACSGHCTVCNQYGDSCSSCSHGWYGDNCEESCNNCIDGVCNITNGYCVRGCQVGYYDSQCTSPCNANCQECLDVIHCTRHTGSCSDGCKDGWFGERCERECSSGCKDHRCNRTTGTCSEGCIASAYGDDCSITDVQDSPIHRHVWILTGMVCCLTLLVLVILIKSFRRKLSSFSLRSPRPLYISPISDDEGSLPLQEVRLSHGSSAHPYASIADDYESRGSIQTNQTDRQYESVGYRQY